MMSCGHAEKAMMRSIFARSAMYWPGLLTGGRKSTYRPSLTGMFMKRFSGAGVSGVDDLLAEGVDHLDHLSLPNALRLASPGGNRDDHSGFDHSRRPLFFVLALGSRCSRCAAEHPWSPIPSMAEGPPRARPRRRR